MRGVLVALLIVVSSSASAQEAGARDADEWEIYFSPYLWAIGLEGTVEARGNSTDFNANPSDLIDKLNFGAMGATEVRRGRFIGILDLLYADLEYDTEVAVGPFRPSLDSEVYLFIGDARLGYTVYEGHLDLQLGPHTGDVALDLLPGVRYWWLRTEVEALGPIIGTRSLDEKTDWVDAVAGARIRFALSERVGLTLLGDYGGFGWGSSSDPTWQFVGMLRYQASEHWWINAGWRALEVDKEQIDATLDGAILGATYRF
jgi:hypothetical protein